MGHHVVVSAMCSASSCASAVAASSYSEPQDIDPHLLGALLLPIILFAGAFGLTR